MKISQAPREAENNNNYRRDCDQSRDERVSVHFSSMVAALKKAVARALLKASLAVEMAFL